MTKQATSGRAAESLFLFLLVANGVARYWQCSHCGQGLAWATSTLSQPNFRVGLTPRAHAVSGLRDPRGHDARTVCPPYQFEPLSKKVEH
jgi:hypothetical protein